MYLKLYSYNDVREALKAEMENIGTGHKVEWEGGGGGSEAPSVRAFLVYGVVQGGISPRCIHSYAEAQNFQ